MVIKNMEAA
jgi:hypothetical protein